MERKLGIISECLRGVHPRESLPMIREMGFDSYFTGHYTRPAVKEIKAISDALGLECTSIHAPFKGINTMWLSGMDYLTVYNQIVESIDSAADNGIPTVVLHLSSGWKAPEINDLGLARYDALVEYAMKRGVNLAFENLRKIGNTAYMVDRYENIPNVGFCFDVGHEHCYTKTVDFMDIFCEKVIMTHIHDNLGRGKECVGDPDTHLLPFDGTVDYNHMMQKLNEYEYKGHLTLEVFNGSRPEYLAMPHEDFLRTCYDRIVKISSMG